MKPVMTCEAIGTKIAGGPNGDVIEFKPGKTGERTDSSTVCTTGSIPWEINSSMADVNKPAYTLWLVTDDLRLSNDKLHLSKELACPPTLSVPHASSCPMFQTRSRRG